MHSKGSWVSTLLWLTLFTFLGIVVYNVMFLKLSGLDAIPYGN